jgi:hypothetical protein
MRPFADDSIFNTPLADDAAIDPTSAAVVATFANGATTSATINTTDWSVPVYVVPENQPTVRVQLIGANAASKTNAVLEAAWAEVPLPPNAQAAGPNTTPLNASGPPAGDNHLVVWQPSTDKLWEFWHLRPGPRTVPVVERNPQTGEWEVVPEIVNGKHVLKEEAVGGWSAEWGGVIDDVSLNPGAYDSTAWPGAANGWGASACSISIAAGLITLDDLAAKRIDHALAVACQFTRLGVWVPPAKRTDGFRTGSATVPEGAHLRIDPDLDLESLEMPPFTLMLARAAQTYGMIVRDSANSIPFYAEDPSRLGINPYTGPTGYFEGKTPHELLASFPWVHLQLLDMALASG